MKYEYEYLSYQVEVIPGLISYKEVRHLMAIAALAPQGTHFVELGPYQGKSTGAFCAVAARNNSPVTTIDNFQWAFRFGNSNANIVYNNLEKFGANLAVVTSDSRKVPQGIGEIGFLFTDTTHTEPHLNDEFAVWLSHLIPGAVLAVHDYHQNFPDVIKVIDQRFENNANWTHLGTIDSLVAFQKKE